MTVVLFCSRSSVYRTVRAYQEGALDWEYDVQGRLGPPVGTTVLLTVAAGPAQGTSRGVWVMPHALERCHAGPDPAGQPGPHGLGRDHAPLLTVVRL